MRVGISPRRAAALISTALLVWANTAATPLSDLRLQSHPATQLLREMIARGESPGAVLTTGRAGEGSTSIGLGRLRWGGRLAPDPERTVYDVASLTKVVATTAAAMVLYDDGLLELERAVQDYLPEFQGPGKEQVTVWHLLTHTSGLPAWADTRRGNPHAAKQKIYETPLRAAPGTRVEYSDVGFVILWDVLTRIQGESPFRLLDQRIYGPMGMRSTTFRPGHGCSICAPTLRRSDGTDNAGDVHDPIAQNLGGVTGNAGLFSTASDLGRFAEMLAGGGAWRGEQILKASTISLFSRPQAGNRALGWETPASDGTGPAGSRMSPYSYGHTGYTGTSIWIDPARKSWAVLLTNRTYAPRSKAQMQALRRSVHDLLVDYPPRLDR